MPLKKAREFPFVMFRAARELEMSKLKSIQQKARELARSGRFFGWRPIAFELSFEDGFAEARDWLYRVSTRDELDLLCREARTAKNEAAIDASELRP
jgi:hypothetical protein